MTRLRALTRRSVDRPAAVPFLWSTLVAAVLLLTAAPAPAPGETYIDNGHGGDWFGLQISQPVEQP